MFGMEAVHSFGRLALRCVEPQMVADMDALHDQHIPFLLDLSPRLGDQFSLAGRNSARFQRAPESSGQSAGGRGHQVIERRGLWFMDFRINAVMFGNLRVYAKEDRLLLGWEIGPSQRPLYPFYSDIGNIRNFISHASLLSSPA